MVSYTPKFVQKSAARANRHIIKYFQREIPMLLAAHHEQLPNLSCRFEMVKDPDQYINGGFIERIKGLYTEDERQFILDISARFERVKLGFAYFSLLHSNRRPFEAIRLSQDQLRTGWQKTGVPLAFNQTLVNHLSNVSMLAFLLFFDDPDIELIEKICTYHDAGEPLVGDFTPHCPISREDKSAIELLGVRLITASRIRNNDFIAQWIYDSVNIYDGNDPSYDTLRSKVRDCDLLEMCLEALFIMTACPEKQSTRINKKLQEFWNYVGPRLTTDRARNFFESLETSRYLKDLSYQGYTDIIQHAHQFMMLQEPNPKEAYAKFREIATIRAEEEEQFKSYRAPV